MLLTIDLGNTSTVFGCFEGSKIRQSWRVLSRPQDLLSSLGRLKKIRYSIDGIIISSVVPILKISLLKICKAIGKKPLFVSAGLKMPIRLRVKNPERVGSDRIVNAVAAYTFFSERAPLLVIDFGTATTFDLVMPDGDFIGGVIAPGLETFAEALSAKCARLPFVRLKPPRNVLGRTTDEAIRSGLMFGYAGLVDALVDKIQKEIGRRCRVIATGGLARRITPLTKTIRTVDPYLTLRGLRILYPLNISFGDT